MTITTGASRRTKGQAVLFITMSLTTMLGLAGLVVDIGWGYWRKIACATAASSAASAAAQAAKTSGASSCGSGTTNWNCSSNYSCPSNPTIGAITSNLDNGCLYAKQNGFLNTGRQSVTFSAGTGTPPTASGITPDYYVVATVTERIPTLFSAAIGQPWMQVSASATAGVFISGGGCIYVLDPTVSGALSMTGTSALSTGCGVYVNSNATGALSMVGSGTIHPTTGGATTSR